MARKLCSRATQALKSTMSPVLASLNFQRYHFAFEDVDVSEADFPVTDEACVSFKVVLLSGEVVAELSLPSYVDIRHVLLLLEQLGAAGSDSADMQLLLNDRILEVHETLEEVGLQESMCLQLIRVKPCFSYKFMLVGDTCVGKTCLFQRFACNQFSDLYEATTTIQSASNSVEIDSDCRVELEIWDTPGKDWHRRCVYFRKASAIMIVFDLTRSVSFSNLLYWLDRISEERGDVLIYLVGNKADDSSQRQVRQDQVSQFAATRGHIYTEVSAKENGGIDTVFKGAAKALIDRRIRG